MSKERKVIYEPHPVSAERKAELVAAGYKIIDARFAPKGEGEEVADEDTVDLGKSSGDQFSDDQLRGAIEAATGQKPHHMLGRAKLIAQFNELNAKAAE